MRKREGRKKPLLVICIAREEEKQKVPIDRKRNRLQKTINGITNVIFSILMVAH